MQVSITILSTMLTLTVLAPSVSIDRISNIAYAADTTQAHRLDLFLPKGRAGAPLVIFVHGGAFMQGTRQEVAAVGMDFAHQGLATAVVSYRLYPTASAKDATQDVATAAAWFIHHATDYGLTSRRVFLVGHSAGAQIVALIGTDPGYLASVGLTLHAVAGVFAVSGAYDLRDLSGEPDSWQRIDDRIYGQTSSARADVSPSQHIDPASAPNVIACGTEKDNPGSCDRALSFERALRRAHVQTKLIEENGPTHIGMLEALINPQDPLNAALLEFIQEQSQ